MMRGEIRININTFMGFKKFVLEFYKPQEPDDVDHEQQKRLHGDGQYNHVYKFTTSKGNKVEVTFDEEQRHVYEVAFDVNGAFENTKKETDLEVMKGVLYIIKQFESENQVKEFFFEAYEDPDAKGDQRTGEMDVASLIKRIKELTLLVIKEMDKERYEEEEKDLKEVLSRLEPNLTVREMILDIEKIRDMSKYIHGSPRVNMMTKQLNNLSNVFVHQAYYKERDNVEVTSDNRRANIFKRFAKKVLGDHFTIEQYNEHIIMKNTRYQEQ
jgi:hypothetical protein